MNDIFSVEENCSPLFCGHSLLEVENRIMVVAEYIFVQESFHYGFHDVPPAVSEFMILDFHRNVINYFSWNRNKPVMLQIKNIAKIRRPAREASKRFSEILNKLQKILDLNTSLCYHMLNFVSPSIPIVNNSYHNSES